MVLKVYSAKMELSTPNPYNSKFTLDVETTVDIGGVTLDVIGIDTDRGHGVLFLEESVPPGTSRKTVQFNDHPLYVQYGIYLYLEGTGESVRLTPDQIIGLSDYFKWRSNCLASARWKKEIDLDYGVVGRSKGGFIAIFSAILDENKRTVTVDVQVDGTTRYYDVYSCWFGLSGYLFKSVGIGRSRVTIDFSDPYYWDLLQKGGLWVQPRDYSGFLVDGFSIPFDQLERIAVELKGTIVRVDPPDGSKIEVGKSVPIRVDARNDSSVAVEAYPLVVVRGVKTGAEYARLTASAVQMNPGEVKTFTATEAFTMPSEDVEVTVVLYMRQTLSYQWYALAGGLRYCPRLGRISCPTPSSRSKS
jgi:hypothetical protein